MVSQHLDNGTNAFEAAREAKDLQLVSFG